MKYVADVMLGRLAKWMRLQGLDVMYDRSLSDNDIIRMSLEQGRVILTRDRKLSLRPLASNRILISSERVKEQIRQVLRLHPQLVLKPLTRCAVCNEPLLTVEKRLMRDLVPQYVYDKYSDFMQCGKCGRTYWKGTHVRKMTEDLSKDRTAGP